MSSTEVVVRRTEVPASFNEQMHMARVLSDSNLLPAYLRGKPANVLVILQGARALDVSAFWALQSMHVIEGKLGMAAELMRALVIRAGHSIRVVERSDKRAVVEIKRSDRDTPYRAEFTIEDARNAKLLGKDGSGWSKYPKSMLVARATSIAVRDECPDVMFGVVYTPEELGAVVDADGEPTVDSAGNLVVDGEAVEGLSDEQVQAISQSVLNAPLEELPAIWATVIDRAAQFRIVEGDNSLTDYIGNRLGFEASACVDKAGVRVIWDLCNTLRLGEVTIVAGGERVDLRGYLRRVGNELPEEAERPAEETAPAVLADDVDEALPDTANAREMAAKAAASWDEDVAKIRGERERVFNDLANARARAAEAEKEQD